MTDGWTDGWTDIITVNICTSVCCKTAYKPHFKKLLQSFKKKLHTVYSKGLCALVTLPENNEIARVCDVQVRLQLC